MQLADERAGPSLRTTGPSRRRRHWNSQEDDVRPHQDIITDLLSVLLVVLLQVDLMTTTHVWCNTESLAPPLESISSSTQDAIYVP